MLQNVSILIMRVYKKLFQTIIELVSICYSFYVGLYELFYIMDSEMIKYSVN